MLHCKYCKNSVVVYLLISTPITHKTLPTFTGMWWGNMQRLNQGANSFYRKCLMLTWYLMLTAFWLAGRWEERTRPKSLQERCRASLNTCWEERRTSPWRLITSSPTPRFSTFLASLKASWIQVRAEAAPVLRTCGRVGVPCELRVLFVQIATWCSALRETRSAMGSPSPPLARRCWWSSPPPSGTWWKVKRLGTCSKRFFIYWFYLYIKRWFRVNPVNVSYRWI